MHKSLFKIALLVALLPGISIARDGKKQVKPQKTTHISDTTTIAAIVRFDGSIDTTGYSKGDTAGDITLYTTNGEPVKVSGLLKDKLPILLVGGSYTCGHFRNHLRDVNNMTLYYQGKLKVYIVYTVEAHPFNCPTPYSDKIDLGMSNLMMNVNYAQPTTFGERRAMADTTMKREFLNAGMLIDGPANDWWNNYGPSPNNAYLIDTNMVIRGKNAMLNAGDENIWCDIDELLHTNSGKCR